MERHSERSEESPDPSRATVSSSVNLNPITPTTNNSSSSTTNETLSYNCHSDVFGITIQDYADTNPDRASGIGSHRVRISRGLPRTHKHIRRLHDDGRRIHAGTHRGRGRLVAFLGNANSDCLGGMARFLGLSGTSAGSTLAFLVGRVFDRWRGFMDHSLSESMD